MSNWERFPIKAAVKTTLWCYLIHLSLIDIDVKVAQSNV